ncbi:MAG: hypothetical protein JKY99_01585 [Rhizobiales bacterium]|nr:hypothetical protein [Hyphomicrobiales bacterium]
MVMKNNRGRLVAFIASIVIAGLLSSCGSLTNYYQSEAAPDHVKAGKKDFRVVFTNVVGPVTSRVFRNARLPNGNLRIADGLREHLKQTLQPLDVVLVRSKPALSRFGIPGHFLHSTIWLGTDEQMKQLGATGLLTSRASRTNLDHNETIVEASAGDVHLVDLDDFIDTDEILIMRPAPMSTSQKRKKYAHINQLLGTKFDTSFDLSDESRLTCIEVIALVFPEFNLPARYSSGRFTLIPDDLAHLAVSKNKILRVIEHIVYVPERKFAVQGRKEVSLLLSHPKEKRNR